ncbi:MAG: septation protein SepH, partial [Streptosporangiales bacterium]
QYAVLGVPGRSARFTLPIDERLRAVALGQTSRLAQYEIEVESPLRPKEIQARIRAGETVEEIADAAGIAVERVRWFEGPVLAERAYMSDQAQLASVRRQGDATPGPRLGEIVAERMKAFGAEPDDAQWDAKKRGDGSWLVQLTFITGGRLHAAEWIFDPRRRHVLPADDNAARMSLPGSEPPQPAAPPPGEATVTHLAPRLSNASGFGPSGTGNATMASAGHGNGAMGNGLGNSLGNGGRARYERPGAARPAVPEPKVAEWEAPQPRETERREPEAPAASAPPVPSAPPASPAQVAAQVSEETQAPPGRVPQPGGVAQPARHARPAQDSRAAEDSRVAEGRQQTPSPSAGGDSATVPPAAAATPAVPAVPSAPPAEPIQSAAPAPAEATGEQATRQSRKTARGRRSSVPSWDEIMFGSSRQRD